MKKEQQQKLIYTLFVPFLVVIIASSMIAAKYPEHINYVEMGLGVVIVLFLAVMIFMLKSDPT